MIRLFLRIVNPEQTLDDEFQAEWQLYRGARCITESLLAAPLHEIGNSLPVAKSEVQTIVLLPGHSVFINEVTTARHHAKHLRSAAMHAVEERLAESVEEVHIALGPAIAAAEASLGDVETYEIGVVQDALMHRLVHALVEAGLTPDSMTVDTLLLPCERAMQTLLLDEGKVLFRLSPGVASGLEYDAFLTFFASYLTQQAKPLLTAHQGPWPVRALQVWSGPMVDEQRTFVDALQALGREHGVEVAVGRLEGSVFDWLCHRWLEANEAQNFPINFLQGSYQLGGWRQSLAMHRKEIALVLLSWLAIQLCFDMATSYYLKYKSNGFYEQSVNLYREVFPQDAVIVDLRGQMNQHLKGATGQGLIALLDVLAGNTEMMHRLNITSLAYDAQKNELTIEATADDFAVLEHYRQMTPPGFFVEVGAVEKEENGVRGEIRIRGGRL